MIIHFNDVSCLGHESNIMQCSKTTLSFNEGKSALASTSVAGVDCLYNEPSECIRTPSWVNDIAGSECFPNGNIRLQGSQQQGIGRLEYCYNGYWSPFCKLNPVVASVICNHLGFTSYSGIAITVLRVLLLFVGASIIPTAEYGIVRNFSLFDNITCAGTESSISQCTVHTSECTPWCAFSNIAINCFSKSKQINGCLILLKILVCVLMEMFVW